MQQTRQTKIYLIKFASMKILHITRTAKFIIRMQIKEMNVASALNSLKLKKI